ncbi:hypothetical protein CDAR_523441 [Caerostris darwini]|uniref:Uncharacterized protein n=1 Tax=Caerostris darwini TaxID=1538125 RepID=A0AAV4QPI9_9ARAC|nr:hypothetical protein CDAR_523441 [Caerostris darwini]
MICTIILFFHISNIPTSPLIKKRINKSAPLKNIHLITINTGKPIVDQLLVYPTIDQKLILENCLKPTVVFHEYHTPINHTASQTIPDITVDLRNPTIDELLTYPTIEQLRHKHTILKPTI